MKKLLNIIFLSLVFITTFVVFFPKDKLYFYLQKKLLAYNVVLESEEVISNPCSIDVKNTYVLLSGSRIASIKNLHVSLLGIKLENVRAQGNFQNTMPSAKTIDVGLGIPEFANANGTFGTIVGKVDISNKKLIVDAKITPAIKNKYNMLFNQFKQKGDIYVYELPF